LNPFQTVSTKVEKLHSDVCLAQCQNLRFRITSARVNTWRVTHTARCL